MSTPQRPVRANDNDFDPADVPSVRGSDIYARAGRVAPQEITPQDKTAKPADTSSDLSGKDTADAAVSSAANTEPTTQFAAPTPQQDILASDAPTTAFDPQPVQPAQQAQPAVNPRAKEVTELLPPLPQAGESELFASSQLDFAPAAEQDVEGLLAAEEAPVEVAEQLPEHRRGTLDFGLLLLRLAFGGILTMQAIAVFFKLFGSLGLSGLEVEYASYNYPSILAVAIPALGLTGGLFILLGLMTPLAAAVSIVYTAFTFLHTLYTTAESAALIAGGLLFGVALALQFTGPGRLSLDFSRSWARRPLASSWILAIVGLAAAGALWWFGAGIQYLPTFGG